MNFITYIFILVPLLLIDGAWLFLMGGNYKKWLGHLFADSVSFAPVALFYILYAFGIYFFVVAPHIHSAGSLLKVFLVGAFLGLISYAAYDLTNQATLRDWPVLVTVVDMVWGALVTGVTSVIAVVLIKMFLK